MSAIHGEMRDVGGQQQPYEPSDAEVRAFANAYGYSVDEARYFLRRHGPDRRYWHGRGAGHDG